MAPTQSTLRFDSGYETDNNGPRRSGRITTPARLGPGMICPPSDSRQSLASSAFTFSLTNDSLTDKGKGKGKSKRARSESFAEPAIDSDAETDTPEIVSGPTRRVIPPPRRIGVGSSNQGTSKVSKKTSAVSRRRDEAEAELALAADAGVEPDLNQDSDEENRRVRQRIQGANGQEVDEYDPPVIYFGKPFCRPNDVSFFYFHHCFNENY
ncbi:uncharacterized protein MELLADRAFT_94154 [Melampsora larici-populina 98AG31]|uniref:Uncharacterized protein n=1 Tax=Melampsora larici-populina (strain 98AG31 / pathotype 3-4-7) TaxID=747676 RepID=F4S6N8_MELLP|nr:uncharacterized protein MELLADRAFT_94154 [Melampsora larici-populina 98AG31]EGF99727.1 hypothetical protein MELLADRAFT_94154 [Melampsora larici-populina 98AG31]